MGRDIPSLIETLRVSDEQSREQAAGRLEQIGRQAVPSLLELLGDESSQVRWRAVWALEEIADPMSVPGLLTALGDPDERVRIGAISALKRIGGDQALNGITRALGDPAWSVRREAARALGEMGDEIAIPYLLDILQQDDDWAVRRVAAVSLGQLGDRRATSGLLAALHDQNVAVRVAAARSLGQIGDKSILPDLKRLLSQQLDNDTRRALEHTLEKLDPASVVKVKTKTKAQPHPLPKTRKTTARTSKPNTWSRPRRIETILRVGMFILTIGIPLLGFLVNLNLRAQAVPHLKQAREYRDEGDLVSAVRSYKLAIELNPKLEPAYFELCQVYDDLDDLDKVIEYCTRAIEFDPTNAEAYYLRGWAYRRSGEYNNSLQDFDRGRVLNPELSPAYPFRIPDIGEAQGAQAGAWIDLESAYDNCREFIDEENYLAAIEQCDRTIELNPEYAEAYYLRGRAYQMSGDYDRALEDFDQTVELDPEYTLAYYNRGLVYEVQGNLPWAWANYAVANDLNPNLAYTSYDRCRMHFRGEHLAAALEQCNQSVRLDPDFAAAYNTLGEIYEAQGNIEAALAEYKRAAELDWWFVSPYYYNQCRIYTDQGEYKIAIEQCSQVIWAEPQYADAYAIRGRAYRLSGDYDRALEDLNQAIELAPAFASPYYNRALIYDDQGDEEAALDDYIRYLEVVENEPEEEANIAHARERVEALGGELPD